MCSRQLVLSRRVQECRMPDTFWIGTTHADMVRRGKYINSLVSAGIDHQSIAREIAELHVEERFPEATADEKTELLKSGKFSISQANISFYAQAWQFLRDADLDPEDQELFIAAHRLMQKSKRERRDVLAQDLKTTPRPLRRSQFLIKSLDIYHSAKTTRKIQAPKV
jgi:hypothetical protein